MKKNIGNVLALYPTPAVVVGTEVNGKVNWLLVAHVGIIGHDQIMLSMFKKHYTNEGVKQTGKVSVNMVNEAMLDRADYVGCASGAKADKSDIFVYHLGEAGMPVIDESPLVMECEVVDNYETETFDNFICKITNTYVDEDCLNEKGKPDYDKLKPVLRCRTTPICALARPSVSAPVSGRHTERRNNNENKNIRKRRAKSICHWIGLHGLHAKLSPVSRP